MDADTAEIYWNAITVIESQQLLLGFKCSDWPNLKSTARSSLHHEIWKQAYAYGHRPSVSIEDAIRTVNG